MWGGGVGGCCGVCCRVCVLTVEDCGWHAINSPHHTHPSPSTPVPIHPPLTPPYHRYYVGVFNYDSYLKEPAQFTLMAEWTLPPTPPPCPLDCSGRGVCNATGMCACDQGAVGDACQFDMQPLVLGGSVSGTLAPGRWVFFDVPLDAGKNERYVYGVCDMRGCLMLWGYLCVYICCSHLC